MKDEGGFVYQTQVANTPNIYSNYDNKKLANVILQGNITATSSFAWRGCVPAPKGSTLLFVTLPHDATQVFVQAVDHPGGTATKIENSPSGCASDVTPSNQSWLDVGFFELFQEQ